MADLFLKLPDEIVLQIAQDLIPSVEDPIEPREDDSLYELLLPFLLSCRRHYAIARHFLWQSVVLGQHGPDSLKKKCEFLMRDDVWPNIKVVFLRLSAPTPQQMRFIETLRLEWVYGNVGQYDGPLDGLREAQKLIVKISQTIKVLVAHEWTPTEDSLRALLLSKSLSTVYLTDDFIANRNDIASVNQAVSDSGLPATTALRKLFISIPSIPNPYELPQALLKRTENLEYLCLRAFSGRLPQAFLPVSAARTLRVLALDVGGPGIGSPANILPLFEAFKQYRELNPSRPSPLSEIHLECRARWLRNEPEDIIRSLRGHKGLKRFSIMVIDEPTPNFFAEIANAMPELEYLSVIGYTGASHSRAGPWPHPSAHYIAPLRDLKHLKTLAWNYHTLRGKFQVVREPRKHYVLPEHDLLASQLPQLERMVIWNIFGNTDYWGDMWVARPSADTEAPGTSSSTTAGGRRMWARMKDIIKEEEEAAVKEIFYDAAAAAADVVDGEVVTDGEWEDAETDSGSDSDDSDDPDQVETEEMSPIERPWRMTFFPKMPKFGRPWRPAWFVS